MNATTACSTKGTQRPHRDAVTPPMSGPVRLPICCTPNMLVICLPRLRCAPVSAITVMRLSIHICSPQPPKNRQEVEALKEVKKTIHQKHPNDGKVFFGFDEYKESLLSETNKDDCPKATVYNWLKRLKEWGYIVNPYEGVWKIIPETLEDVSS